MPPIMDLDIEEKTALDFKSQIISETIAVQEKFKNGFW